MRRSFLPEMGMSRRTVPGGLGDGGGSREGRGKRSGNGGMERAGRGAGRGIRVERGRAGGSERGWKAEVAEWEEAGVAESEGVEKEAAGAGLEEGEESGRNRRRSRRGRTKGPGCAKHRFRGRRRIFSYRTPNRNTSAGWRNRRKTAMALPDGHAADGGRWAMGRSLLRAGGSGRGGVISSRFSLGRSAAPPRQESRTQDRRCRSRIRSSTRARAAETEASWVRTSTQQRRSSIIFLDAPDLAFDAAQPTSSSVWNGAGHVSKPPLHNIYTPGGYVKPIP